MPTSNEMTYPQAIAYLYNVAPLFQHVGGDAYKPGLDTSLALDEHYAHPHHAYRTIHVAGTNGKGSVCHTLAAILQATGLRVGLYTSPHLLDFRERIRVNGRMIPPERVARFVNEERHFFEPLHPSFFELTTALAFLYFREAHVDVAVIEVGMGGRLDSTNILPSPDLTVITNVSLDHTHYLGSTLPLIAREKAGIIKPHVPVVVGETAGDPTLRHVFTQRAAQLASPITFADEAHELVSATLTPQAYLYQTLTYGSLQGQLRGLCQPRNTATILSAVSCLTSLGYSIPNDSLRQGLSRVTLLTGGPLGRWQRLRTRPTVICDVAHNPAGLALVSRQLTTQPSTQPHGHLYIILGMCADKDIPASLSHLPRGEGVSYHFTQATSTRRALPPHELARIAMESCGIRGDAYTTVMEAYHAALRQADPVSDTIFIGGSNFVVAELLAHM